MKEIKAYQCSYCGYYKKTKSSVLNHEDRCYKNPKNRACASCKHNVLDSETIYNPDHGGDPGSTVYEAAYNYCNRKEVVLTSKNLCYNCALWDLNDA